MCVGCILFNGHHHLLKEKEAFISWKKWKRGKESCSLLGMFGELGTQDIMPFFVLFFKGVSLHFLCMWKCVCARVCMCVIVVRFVKLISTCNCFSSTCFQNHSENGRRGRGRRKQVCPKAGFMVAWLRLSFQSNSEFNTNTHKVISPPVFNCIFNKSNKKKDQKETFHHKNGSENQGPRWSQNEQFH